MWTNETLTYEIVVAQSVSACNTKINLEVSCDKGVDCRDFYSLISLTEKTWELSINTMDLSFLGSQILSFQAIDEVKGLESDTSSMNFDFFDPCDT